MKQIYLIILLQFTHNVKQNVTIDDEYIKIKTEIKLQNKKIEQQEININSLKDSLAEQKQIANSRKTELEASQAQASQLRDKFEKALNRADEQEAKTSAVSNQIVDLQQDIDSKKNQIDNMTKEIQALKTTLKTSQTESENQQSMYEKIENKYNSLKDKLNSNQIKQDEQESKLAEQKKKYEDEHNHNEARKKQLANSQNDVTQLLKVVEHVRSKSDDLENKNSNLNTQLEEYKQVALARKTAVDNTTQRLTDMKSDNDLAHLKLDEAESTIKTENKTINNFKSKLQEDEEVKNNLKLLQGTQSALNEKYELLVSDIKNMTKQLKDEDVTLNKLSKDQQTTKMELKIAKNILLACKNELKPAINDALNAKKTISKQEKASQKSINIEQGEIRSIENENQTIKEKLESLKSSGNNLNRIKDEVITLSTTNTNQITSLEDQESQIEAQIKRLKEANTKQSNDNSSLDIDIRHEKNYENTLFKINDFENQITDSDINNLNKSLTSAVDRIDINEGNKQDKGSVSPFQTLNSNNNSNSNNIQSIDNDNQIIKSNQLVSNTKSSHDAKPNIDVDQHYMKIDREVFQKFKNSKNNEQKHYCRIKNNNLEFRKIIVGGFSFEDKNTFAKVVQCCNDLKQADMKGQDDLQEANIAYAQGYQVDNLYQDKETCKHSPDNVKFELKCDEYERNLNLSLCAYKGDDDIVRMFRKVKN